MSMLYNYWVLRHMPDTFRAEQVNIGVLVGDDKSGDWALRFADDFRRANLLGGAAERLEPMLRSLRERIYASTYDSDALIETPRVFSRGHIDAMQARQQNALRISGPTQIVAESADEALGILYPLLVQEAEPTEARRRRPHLLRQIRQGIKALEQEVVTPPTVHEAVNARSDAQRGKLDFVMQSDDQMQAVHAFTYQTQNINRIFEVQQSWTWFIRSIREHGGAAHLTPSQSAHDLSLGADIPVIAFYDQPQTSEQYDALEAAKQAWTEIDVIAHPVEQVEQHLASFILQPSSV